MVAPARARAATYTPMAPLAKALASPAQGAQAAAYGGPSLGQIDSNRALAMNLMNNATEGPTGGGWGALAKALTAGVGAYAYRKADQQESEAYKGLGEALKGAGTNQDAVLNVLGQYDPHAAMNARVAIATRPLPEWQQAGYGEFLDTRAAKDLEGRRTLAQEGRAWDAEQSRINDERDQANMLERQRQQHGYDMAEAAVPGRQRETENERQISQLQARGFSREDAEDIAYGIVTITQPDTFGNVYKVNKATGDSQLIAGPMAGQGRNSAPGAEPQGAQAPPPAGPSLAEDVGQSTGVVSNAADLVNRTVGQVMPGTPFPEIAGSRQRVQMFRQSAMEALVNNPRFPVEEQKRVLGMLGAEGEWLQDPDVAQQNIGILRNYLDQKKQAIMQSLNSGAPLTMESRGTLTDQLAAIDRVMTQMGAASPAETMGAQGGLPEGIPQGSQLIGTTRAGSPVYQTPDGEQLVVE